MTPPLLDPEESLPLSIGVEGGWMRNLQSGSFITICSCNRKVEDSKGNSGLISLFFDFQANKYFHLGAKLGYDIKSASSSRQDTSEIVYATGTTDDSIFHGPLEHTLRTDISANYIFLAPYISITPFGESLFIQIASEIGNLSTSNMKLTRELSKTIILSNEDTLTSLHFLNGKNTEILQDESIKDVNKLRLALLFSIGYDISLFEHLSIFPSASYHLPLTLISSNSLFTDWKISSYAFSLGVKYRFY